MLVVAKFDRVSSSLLDFAELLQKSQREGWSIVALDLGLDLSTPTGRLAAGVMPSVAEWDRPPSAPTPPMVAPRPNGRVGCSAAGRRCLARFRQDLRAVRAETVSGVRRSSQWAGAPGPAGSACIA